MAADGVGGAFGTRDDGDGAGAFSVLGAWFSDNGLMLAVATAVAVAFVVAAGFIYVRRANAAACEKT